MIKLGFTGTRHGMSETQKQSLSLLLYRITNKFTKKSEFRHGDCIGSDAEAHDILCKKKSVHIIIHPPAYNKFRAYKKGDITLKPLPYIERNHNIVDESEIIIATPDTTEKLHSGTWATIRYARKKRKIIYIIKTSGVISTESQLPLPKGKDFPEMIL